LGRDKTSVASERFGSCLTGGDEIPGGNEKWIPAGDGDPFSHRGEKDPRQAGIAWQIGRDTNLTGHGTCEGIQKSPSPSTPLPRDSREGRGGKSELVGFKEPRTRVCGSFYSELGRRVEKLILGESTDCGRMGFETAPRPSLALRIVILALLTRSVSEAAPTRRIPRTNFQAVSREAARLASDGEGAPIAILRRDAATCPA
jgi:hypothetical protein